MTTGSGISNKKFESAILELENAFKRNKDQILTADQVKMWYRYLKHLTDSQLSSAVKTIIYNDNFFPSIARVIEASGAPTGKPPRALTEKDIENMGS